MSGLLAVVPVRDGELPSGGAEAVAEASGRAILVGEGATEAAESLAGLSDEVRVWDVPGFAPGAWADHLAPLLVEEQIVVLPASPDGRDLAPRLAAALGRPLFASAMEIRDDSVVTILHGGQVLADHHLTGPAVVTLQPGVRGVERVGEVPPRVIQIEQQSVGDGDVRDAALVEVLAPDVSTMDLAESPRIIGGGAGLDSPDRFVQLADIAERLEASVGATRVITDRGWIDHARQIGTTGVVVDPTLYLAFGISGAVQHTAGLGQPDHIISVNIDEHSPMMTMADMAVVSDANETLDRLQAILSSTDSDNQAEALD